MNQTENYADYYIMLIGSDSTNGTLQLWLLRLHWIAVRLGGQGQVDTLRVLGMKPLIA